MGKGQRHVQEKGTKEGLLTGGWQLKGGRGWGATGSRNQEERWSLESEKSQIRKGNIFPEEKYINTIANDGVKYVMGCGRENEGHSGRKSGML